MVAPENIASRRTQPWGLKEKGLKQLRAGEAGWHS
jgi:hypothetical protein